MPYPVSAFFEYSAYIYCYPHDSDDGASMGVEVPLHHFPIVTGEAVIVSEGEKNVWPAIAEGKVKPVVYKYIPLSEAAGHTAS
ncbi:hypothetical protein Ahy_A10g051033 [Arachis hypogaea]|uniref:Uncharacterized protein n=1 Tax=Arachis hypogaea TaxID=3818 RepID=A0A445BBC7_ARAHY|nr:hypothetical protein Ahy_A10g051033 [Arachis hypogaea]